MNLNIEKRLLGIATGGLLQAVAMMLVMAGHTQASPFAALQSASLQLDADEIAWIAEHPVIRVHNEIVGSDDLDLQISVRIAGGLRRHRHRHKACEKKCKCR